MTISRKLSMGQVKEILELRRKGDGLILEYRARYALEAVAKQFGVAPNTISKVWTLALVGGNSKGRRRFKMPGIAYENNQKAIDNYA